MRILVIEDEAALLEDIKSYLETENLIVEIAGDFREGLTKISDYEYDCVVVDINLPNGSGFELIKELKLQNSKAGIIIVSARNSLDDRLLGLNLGSDDYLVKPFHLSELNARINSILRRRLFDGNNLLRFCEIEINLNSHIASVKGLVLPLTRKEYDLLLYFVINKNRVLSQASIVEHLWSDDIELSDSYAFLYTHIRNLRKKLTDAGCKSYLKSIYSLGYKWEEI